MSDPQAFILKCNVNFCPQNDVHMNANEVNLLYAAFPNAC